MGLKFYEPKLTTQQLFIYFNNFISADLADVRNC